MGSGAVITANSVIRVLSMHAQNRTGNLIDERFTLGLASVEG